MGSHIPLVRPQAVSLTFPSGFSKRKEHRKQDLVHSSSAGDAGKGQKRRLHRPQASLPQPFPPFTQERTIKVNSDS